MSQHIIIVYQGKRKKIFASTAETDFQTKKKKKRRKTMSQKSSLNFISFPPFQESPNCLGPVCQIFFLFLLLLLRLIFYYCLQDS